jgi:peptidyl-prolyl cis-trans isomerase C
MSCTHHVSHFPRPEPVSVNGVVIRRDDIAGEMQHHPAPKPIFAWQEAARALVVRQLLLQEAQRLGVKAIPRTDYSGRRETEEEALIRAVCEREEVVPEPDHQTCRRYYDRNRKLFLSPSIFEVAHILIAARRDSAEAFEKARTVANSLLTELRHRPEVFGDLARLHSACPSARQGGSLGQISTGQTTPEFEQALMLLTPGSLSRTPVVTRYGFHIIRLDRKTEGQELPFELVADRIADYLRESISRRASAQYVARLVARAEIGGIAL